MIIIAEKEIAHIGKTHGAADHDHDMVHELSKRRDALWRDDQYIANAEGHRELQDFWQKMKNQEQGNVQRLKEIVIEHARNDGF